MKKLDISSTNIRVDSLSWLYSLLIIYHFEAGDLILQRVIFEFHEDKSNNVFREILKYFRKTAKFEFFAKQIIYLESPDHPLQNDI